MWLARASSGTYCVVCSPRGRLVAMVTDHGVDKAGAVLTVDFSLLHCSSESPGDVGGITESWLLWLSAMSFVLLIACMRARLLQSCLTLCDPMDCSLPGSSVLGILQIRMLKWFAIPSYRGSSQSRDQTQISCIAGGLLLPLSHWEVHIHLTSRQLATTSLSILTTFCRENASTVSRI